MTELKKSSDRETVVSLLREKADIYDDHPDYGWLLPGDALGNYIAYELRSVADLIDWLAEREESNQDNSA